MSGNNEFGSAEWINNIQESYVQESRLRCSFFQVQDSRLIGDVYLQQPNPSYPTRTPPSSVRIGLESPTYTNLENAAMSSSLGSKGISEDAMISAPSSAIPNSPAPYPPGLLFPRKPHPELESIYAQKEQFSGIYEPTPPPQQPINSHQTGEQVWNTAVPVTYG